MADMMLAGGDDKRLPTSLSTGAMDAMSAIVAILDPDGTIVAVNAAWRRFAHANGGRDPEHFVGWSYLFQCDRVQPSAPDATTAYAAARGLRDVLAGTVEVFEQEYPCHGPGHKRWMRLGARAFAEGGRRFAAVAHENITERVLAERARDQQLALLRSMFDSALDAIVTINARGTIEAVNPAAGSMFGYTPDELCGRNVTILLPPSERSRSGLSAELLQAGSAAIRTEREITGLRRDGTRVPLLLRVSEAQVGDRRVFMGVLHDLSERKAAEAERLEKERRELVVRELGHRIKNIFATVTSVSQMLARTVGSVGEYRDALTDRLRSLAATQVLLTEGGRQGVMLDELVAFELAAYAAEGRLVDVVGDRVRLSPQGGQLLSMAVHELATNAAKYGALASPDGRLAVRWRCTGEAAARRLDFLWVERGGPRATPPTRKGFGTTLIERGIRAGLGADVTLEYAIDGLTCRLCIPLNKVKAADA